MTAGEDQQEITTLVMNAKDGTTGSSIPAEGRNFYLRLNIKAGSGFRPVLYPWGIRVLSEGIQQMESKTRC
jgi:hypothetical protein